MAKHDDEHNFDETDLGALIANEISNAREYSNDSLGEDKAMALEYMRGVMTDVPATPNGSSVTSRDLPDTISWILPSIIRLFVGSGRMADYEPVEEMRPGQEERRERAQQAAKQLSQQQQPIPPELQADIDEPTDEDFANQATDYINYVFFKDNLGYKIVHDVTYDSLLGGDGIVGHFWDKTPVTDITTHTGLSEDQLAVLLDNEGIEVLAHSETSQTQVIEGPDGPVEIAVPYYDVKIEKTLQAGRIAIEAFRPENFFIDDAADDIEDFRFCAARYEDKTRSDLIEMGFDRELIDEISSGNSFDGTEEGLSREGIVGGSFVASDNRSMETIDLFKCYLKIDVDGDGIAETIQVWYAGDAGAGTVLDWELWEDDVPFSRIPCYPVAHRFRSQSVADRTMDIQRIKTTLMRQAINNGYASGMPMKEAEANSVLNTDILVSPKFNGIIWKKRGTAPIVRHEVAYTADKSFYAMDMMDKVLEKRTGVSKTTMGLDADALQNQTATASNNTKDAAYSQIELIARNMAEYGGWTRVFRQILKLVVRNQDRKRTIRLRGEFVEMDPRSWDANMHATVNVGLGTGSKDRDIAALTAIQSTQVNMADRLAASGFRDDAIDFIPKILRTSKKLVESTGIPNPENYWPEFSAQDIEEMKEKAAQAAQQEDPAIALEKLKHADDMKLRDAESKASVVRETAQMQADLQVSDAKLQNDMILEQEKTASDERLKIADINSRREVALMKLSIDKQKLDLERYKFAYDVGTKEAELGKVYLERNKNAN